MNKIFKNKLFILFGILAVICVLIGILFFVKQKENKITADYYYTFKYDENLISQTVKVFDKNGKQQEKYYLFNGERLITATKGNQAILTIAELDLKNGPDLEIVFDKDLKVRYQVQYRK